MKKSTRILWGCVLVGLGIVFALNAFQLTDIKIFFDGWWSLFIIVPCFIGLFTEKEKTGNLIGLAIGVFLLLCAQDVLSFSMVWKLLVPAIIVVIGIKMIFGGIFGNKSAEVFKRIKDSGTPVKNGNAVFAGTKLNFAQEVFEGAELNAVFGGVECDLRNAIIEKDAAINASAIFGGIDMYVPDNIQVKVNSNSAFGGVSNKARASADVTAPTLYINAACIFGGLEIK